MLAACGGGGGGGGGAIQQGDNSITNSTSTEGTKSSPVAISLAGSLPYAGTVDSSETSYYLLQGLSAGLDYAVTFDNINGNILPLITADSSQSCFYTPFSSQNTCIAAASSNGDMLIAVKNDFSASGSSFRISAMLAAEAGQGSPGSPVAIEAPANYGVSLSAGASTSSYDPGNSGYYQITGLTPNNRYLVELTGISVGADLYVYQDDFTAEACVDDSYSALSDRFCAITAKASSILVRVRSDDSGDATLTTADHGAASIPGAEGSAGGEIEVEIDASYLNASVDDTESYYTYKGLVPGQSYQVSVSGLTDNADLYVYTDSSYSTLACSSTNAGTNSESCTIVPDAASQLWVVVDGSTALADLGATYWIVGNRITENQGSAVAPWIIDSNTDLPYRLSSDGEDGSYYKITGLSADTDYLVSLKRNSHSPALEVHSSNGFASYPPYYPCSGFVDPFQHCLGSTNAAGELFVTSTNDAGTAYLNVAELPVSEGSPTAPLEKNMDTLGNLFTGEVVEGQPSAYALTSLTPNTPYYVRARFDDNESSAVLSVYNTFAGDLDAESAACIANWGELNNGCTATTDANGKLWLIVGGWGVDVGAHFSVEALSVPTSEGTSIAPVDISASLPYTSTVGSDSESFYMVTGLSAGSEYLFSLNGNTTDSDLLVYRDSGQTNLICNDYSSSGRDGNCVAAMSTDIAYITVDNIGYQTKPGYASLNVIAVPPAEGTGPAPVEVTTSHNGSVNVGVSYYHLSSLAANTSYTVSLTGVTGDPDLYVFNNAEMQGAPQCHSIKGKGRDESCQATSDASGGLWVVVDGSLSEGGGSYFLQAN
tara:strand:+ start:925 stop:3402 length:2478 start_codon:yes stop_codon:yes gene_type:complete